MDEAIGSPHEAHVSYDDVVVDARPAPAQGLGGLSLSEVWQAVTRYKPVGGALLALIAAAIVLPGAKVLDAVNDPPGVAASVPPAGGSSAGGGSEPAATAGASATEPVLFTEPAADLPAPAPLAYGDGAPRTTTSDLGAAASAPPAPSARASDSPAPAATAPPVALAPSYGVREGGWATAQSASPVSSAGIPEGGLPVGRRLGETDKISFVRLTGRSSALVLKVSSAAGANRLSDQAKIRACRILSSAWEAKPAQSFDAAPPYDRNACAAGEVQSDGSWRFDLAAFSDAADTRGFAFVPADDAGPDFQLVFTAA